MASHESHGHPEQQDNGRGAWNQQPGLEIDSGQRHSLSDKQTVPHVYQPDEHEHARTGTNFHQKRSRNPFGLSPLLFGLLIALVTAVIIGGAVGGGVGSQVKSCSVAAASISTTTVLVTETATNSAASPTSSSSTYTNYIPVLPVQILSVPLDCPNLNTRNIVTADGTGYTFVCGVDYVGNDLSALIAYRLEDCCTACSAYNYQQINAGLSSRCLAFTFNANMSYAYANDVPPGGNNCWLKSKSDQGNTFTDSEHLVVGGKLAA